MLKKYKNEFMDIVEEENLNPESFSASDNADQFTISLEGSLLSFTAEQQVDNFHIFRYKHTSYQPGLPTILSQGYEHITAVTKQFRDWLNLSVKEYLDELMGVDKWLLLEEQKRLFPTSIGRDDMESFSDEEKAQLRLAINEFKLQIKNEFNPNDEQLTAINDRLDYVSGALDRLNKIDWRSVMITTLINLSITLALDSEKTKILHDIFKSIFSTVIRLLN